MHDSRFTLPDLPDRTTRRLFIAGMLFLVTIVYGLSLGNHFVAWDDNYVIFYNPVIKQISLANIWRAFTSYDPELYVPLTTLTYMLDYAVAGQNAFVFHLQNLLLHALNAMLVGWLLYLLTGRNWVALLCAALFAVHPLNTEAVAWASARKDVLSTALFLGSLIAYLYYRERMTPRTYWISLGLFALGLLSKVMILTLPVALLLLDLRDKRPLRGRTLWEKIPFFLLSAVFGIVAMYGKISVAQSTTLLQKILMAGKSTVFYLQKFIIPTKLSVLYPFNGTIELSPEFLIPLTIVLALVIAAFVSLRYGRMMFVGIMFFLITLTPTFINFAKGGEMYFASDRYAYVPMIGLLLLLAGALAHWTTERYKHAVIAVFSVVVALFAGLAYQQSLTWRDSETLFQQTLAHYPDAIAAHINISLVYQELDRVDEAISHLEQALAIHDHTLAHTNLASLYERKGDRDRAFAEIQKALALDPVSPPAHYGHAILLMKAGRTDEAIATYKKTIELDPTFVGGYTNLAAIYLQQDKTGEAEALYKQALARDQYYADGYYNLGIIYEQTDRNDEAIGMFARAAELDPPKSGDAEYHLALALLKARRTDEAVAAVNRALDVAPNHADALFLRDSMRKHGIIR